MNREKSLLKNTFILSIGRFLPKISSFITLPILTAFLTKAEYGSYDLITSLIMLVMPIITLQIQTAAFRYLIDCRDNDRESSKIISNILYITIPISLLVSFAIQFFFGSFSIWTRVFISAYFFLDTIHLTLGQIVRGLGRNKVYSIDAILISFINMAGVVVGVYFLQKGILAVVASVAVAQLVGVIYLSYAVKIWKYLSRSFLSRKKLFDLISYSWPMVPNNLSTWVLKLSDRLVITALLGIEANAVYSVANKIPHLLSTAQNVLVMAWHENASLAANDADVSQYYSKVLDRVFRIMFGCTALLIAGTPVLFSLFIKGDYGEAYDQMPVLILAMFFYVMSSFLGGIYIAHKRTKSVGITTIIAAIINLSIDVAFVKVIGIWAGSISTLVAYVFLYVYRLVNCQKFQPISVNLRLQIIQIMILIIMLIMCFSQNMVFDIINLMLGLLFSMLFNKNLAFRLFRKLKSKVR